MSADNWTTCPRCVNQAQNLRSRRIKEAQEAYGKVPAADYLHLLGKADKLAIERDSLREDYYVGVNVLDGVFSVSYLASCEHCGFEFRFKHEECVPIDTKSDTKSKQ